jgi:transcriptional regulator with XRE-family HTH domain
MARKIPSLEAIDRKIGKMIRELRISAGMSRQQLADQISVTHQQLKKYEDGDNRISAGRLAAIAIALNKPVSYFFDEDTQNDSAVLPTDHQRMCIELARNFMKIEDPTYKQAVNDLVRNLAKETTE